MPRRLKIQKQGNVLELDHRLGPSAGPGKKEREYKEPESWTIITALNRVLDQSQNSELDDEFWASVKNPLAYLREQLGLTDIDILLHDTEDCYEPMWDLGDLSTTDALYLLEELEEIADFHKNNPDKELLTEYDADFDWENY